VVAKEKAAKTTKTRIDRVFMGHDTGKNFIDFGRLRISLSCEHKKLTKQQHHHLRILATVFVENREFSL
jgi:hypothetical protein